jgi:hypothetical protein
MMKKLTFETLVESIQQVHKRFYRLHPQFVGTPPLQLKHLLPLLIELKVDEFSHQFLGQLNTYVSWYKKNILTGGDNPPVGILLCTRKDHALVEYALEGMDNQLFMERKVRWKQI